MSSIAELLEEAEAAVRSAGDLAALDAVRVRYLGKKGSFTAKNAKVIKLRSAVYNGAKDTVTLTVKKPFALKKPVQLLVDGVAPLGLQDNDGRFIDGNHDGQPGGNAVALLNRSGATISALAAKTAAVDRLLSRPIFRW